MKNETEMNYRIYNSVNGEVLIASIKLPADSVENLSSDTQEGHFRAGSLSELTEAGLDPEQLVFATIQD